MTHPRATIRAAIRDAIAADTYFDGTTILAAWGQDIDAGTLPAIGVFTPREVAQASTGNAVNRITDVVIQMRRSGGADLEDLLDDDSARIEALVLPVLSATGAQLFGIDSTDMDIRHQGEARIGMLNIMFRAVRYTPEGLPA